MHGRNEVASVGERHLLGYHCVGNHVQPIPHTYAMGVAQPQLLGRSASYCNNVSSNVDLESANCLHRDAPARGKSLFSRRVAQRDTIATIAWTVSEMLEH